ncbi:hybrid sensor histidine kinase/response regulator [Alkalinema sp. FACHB-956]|uniref:hybrid sensor histidine kinase/response regulator n=1 Tax=Alkalinema sp. FACHB-956 TaxID=2692768 RepID=UPI001685E844|nr:hybrid sensor histidine kinase/response regulator [Alkalinema sp. FACHB-956]MBD2326493.1 hybrid sensor histidine kinase/response regulator [Alkalinema sp. FACHB-956]
MKKPVVICIDDEPAVLDSLKIELRRSIGSQCLVETAEDGAEALELLEDLQSTQHPIAVMIADYIMPGLKGDELLRLAHAQSPQTLKILLSGQADLAAVSRTIEVAQLYRFILKPWHSEDLTLTVRKAIQSYLQSQQIEQQTQELQDLYNHVLRLNEGLEQQVQERTAQLNHSLQELQILSQLKDDFLHAVSHDLRTPLTGMLMVLRRLQSREDPLVLPRNVLDRLVEGGNRQLKLLETLVEAHFSEIHGLQLRQEPLQVDRFLQSIVQELEALVQAQQGYLILDLPAPVPEVIADGLQLQRVFDNLISNALKYNAPGLTIRLSATATEAGVLFSVQDDGVGMSQTECDSLFERYARGGNRAQRSVGLGLGLFLCRQIILAHGGQIQATSQPGQGLHVEFLLPHYPALLERRSGQFIQSLS